jgi:hypothetical protein
MAPLPRLQDRGRRERVGVRQIGIVLDARVAGRHQARGDGQEADLGDLHACADEVPREDQQATSIDFASLVVLGPLVAQRWRFEDPGCPWPITAELWKRGDGERMMELSIKASAAHAAVAVAGFMAFLAEVGAERDKEQQTKTRWALEYYVANLGKAAQQKGKRR